MIATPPAGTSDADALYEIVDGRMVVKARNFYDTYLASELLFRIERHALAHTIGWGVAQGLFHMPATTNDLRPDVAFVSNQTWPLTRGVPTTNAANIVPDLAVEVVSPPSVMNEVVRKVGEYFRAGVSAVWVVRPVEEQVYVYTSPTAVRVLTRADELTGDPAVPGFRLPLADLFPPPDAPDEPTA